MELRHGQKQNRLIKDAAGKDVKNAWIYDETNACKCEEINGAMGLSKIEKHGFSKIPIGYLSQENPEYFDVQAMIDRFEVTLSKLGASKDYKMQSIRQNACWLPGTREFR